MERKVERERKLPSFAIDLGDLEALLQRLRCLFNDEASLHCSIDIPLKREHLCFKSVEEIREYSCLKGTYSKFHVKLSDQKGRVVIINSGCGLFFQASASAMSESEAWSAGVIETVVSFIQTRSVWYHWFIAWPFTPLAILIVMIPYFLQNILHIVDPLRNTFFASAWLVVLIVFMIISFAKGTLLPAATLIISNEDRFFKRYQSELTFVVALASALLTIIGWFVDK